MARFLQRKFLPGAIALLLVCGFFVFAGMVKAFAPPPVPVTDVYVDATFTAETCALASHTPDVDCFITIQAGVNAVDEGGTVHVASGTYNESVLIAKQLTLVGEGATKPVVSGVTPNNYIIEVSGVAGVVIDNFEVNGGGEAVDANGFDYGILVDGAGSESSPTEIKNSLVKNIWKNGSNGIGVENGSYALVHHNTVSSFHKRGIRFINSGGKFYNNEVIGDNVDGTSRVQNLVNLWGGSNVEINNNKLHNALTSGPTPTWDSPGIFVSSYGGEGASIANIHDNEIYDCDTGIVIGSYYAAIDTSSATITNNDLHNLNWAINFEKGTASAVIHKNKFTTVNKAVNADDGDGGPAIKPEYINAEDNWWGTAYRPTIQSLVYGSEVDFDPYYVDAAKTTKNTPLPDKVYIDDDYTDGSSGDYIYGYNAFRTIQEGIDGVKEEGTVNVASGEYNESLDIEKSLTLLGDKGDIAPGPAESAPVIVECDRVISIEADNVTVSGFILDGDDNCRPVVRVDWGISGATISDNEIKNGNKGIDLTAGSAENIIDNNLIHNNDNDGIWLGGSNDNTISNNEIYYNSTGIGFGAGGCDSDDCDGASGNSSDNLIENNNIHDNSGYTTGIHIDSMGSGNAAHHNKITSNDHGIINDDGEQHSFDATMNWWGDASGPRRDEGNPDGEGDSIDGDVVYNPWYGSESLNSLRGMPDEDDRDYKITADFDGSNGDFILTIPANTTVTGSADWNGDLNPPTITDPANTPSAEGYTTEMSKTIEVGFADDTLLLSHAARLLLPGEAGKRVGYTRAGQPFTEITTVCGADTQVWADENLGANGDCKMDVGSDLVVWTKHFTQFSTFTMTAIPPVIPPTSGGGGGGFTPSPCASVDYDDWQTTCVNNLQYRNIKTLNPTGCQMTQAQRDAAHRACQVAGEKIEGGDQTPPPTQGGGQVLGDKVCAPDSLLKGPDGKIYLIRDGAKYWIRTLKELATYRNRQTCPVDADTLSQYPDWTAPQQVLGLKVWPDGSLLRGTDKKVWLIVKGQRFHIINLKELWKYRGRVINDVSDETIAQYPILPKL